MENVENFQIEELQLDLEQISGQVYFSEFK